ncbi:polyphosphate polymerase domain-containing protein [Cellulomonas bogoriensis]|uniref:Molecular chaperone n=1 Tax=Cellulomonas bogoriensis 69B4 = DSM 16987 TaxID=1386082 RepID=A0A0A0BYA3_9CELL|nr:polyphosphate polymerase domain-containing protein [Cellulomonas bogoriensis]KGM13368.1 molecular chaperone [Cellulomonas bogoriensis 69B4 = DSM 16987]
MTALATATTPSTGRPPTDPVGDLVPISLQELVDRASLQTRVDRKYVVPADAVDDLLRDAADQVQVLQIGELRTFAYESVYFDTPDLLAYRLAAHRRRRRFKIRTRTYLDSAQCFLEVKTRGTRGSTVKDRLAYDPDQAADITPGRWYVENVLSGATIPGTNTLELRPTLVTRYLRTTLFLPRSCSRVTVDTHLTWQDDRATLDVPHLAVVETKTGSCPSPMDRLLWSRGHRPVGISKYATGLAALDPDLPSNRWRRTLRRHVHSPAREDRTTDPRNEQRSGTCHARP